MYHKVHLQFYFPKPMQVAIFIHRHWLGIRSPYTKEERLQKALDYLEENKEMKVSQYMELTCLGHTTAACELREFSRDASSGMDSVWRGSAVVYVKKSQF